MPHNIERSAFRRGEYVGHASSPGPGIWRIRRREGGGWRAAYYVGGQDAGRGFIFAPTLAALSLKL